MQPELCAQFDFREHRQHRLETRLEPEPGVADADPFLVSILMHQAGRIEIESIAAGARRQAPEPPAPEAAEAGEIAGAFAKRAEEPREGRLAGHALHGQDLGHHRIPAQPRHLRQLPGPGEHAGDEAQGQLDRGQRIRAGGPMRQHGGELLPHPLFMEESPEPGLPRMTA